MPVEKEMLSFANAADFELWVEANSEKSVGIWLKIAKKGSGVDSVSYSEALEVALCYGWIDSQKKSFDSMYFLQAFGPRKSVSLWSQINREKVQTLMDAGRMRSPGLKAIEVAKANGRWDAAYQSFKSREIPPELQSLLKIHPVASAFFDQLDSQNRYAFVFRVQSAKTIATKLERARKFVEMLEKHEVFYPKT